MSNQQTEQLGQLQLALIEPPSERAWRPICTQSCTPLLPQPFAVAAQSDRQNRSDPATESKRKAQMQCVEYGLHIYSRELARV